MCLQRGCTMCFTVYAICANHACAQPEQSARVHFLLRNIRAWANHSHRAWTLELSTGPCLLPQPPYQTTIHTRCTSRLAQLPTSCSPFTDVWWADVGAESLSAQHSDMRTLECLDCNVCDTVDTVAGATQAACSCYGYPSCKCTGW